MDPNDVTKFKTFITTCQKTPEILWIPELKFFREFIESLGGNIPKVDENKPAEKETEPESEKMDESTPPVEESEESDVELDNEGILEQESEEFPEMGDGSKLVSEDDEVEAGEKRSEAMAAMSDGDFDKAIELFTEAIKINPLSAMLYAKRANILLKQKRVKAALRDCDEAVKLNPDFAAAHKYRGRAYRLLGQWLEAVVELRLACRLDFDEQSHEWLKEVEPNASKIEEHNRKYERKRKEKLQEEKVERIRKAKEENKKAQEEQDKRNSMPGGFPGMPGGFPGGFPGGMPGGFPGGFPGGMPGGFPGGATGAKEAPKKDSGGMPDMGNLFNDPDVAAAMEDPEVSAALQDISTNPNNIFKYKDNTKVSSVIKKLMSKFGGGSGGFMPGFPGGPAPPGGGSCPAGFDSEPTIPPPKSSSDDLD